MLKVLKWPFWLLCAVLFLFVLFIELFAFNHFYWSFDSQAYSRQEITLPFNQDLGTRGAVLTAQNSVLTLNEVNAPLRSIYLDTRGSAQLLRGTIYFTDASSAYSFIRAQSFVLSPGGRNTSVCKYLHTNGSARQLKIEFSGIKGSLVLTKLILNEPPAFEFSWLRFILMAAGFIGCAAVLRFRLYAVTLDFSRRSHRAAHLMNYLAALLLLFAVFDYVNPQHTNPIVFQYVNRGATMLGNAQHSLLLDYPESAAELDLHEQYVRLFDAFRHGRFSPDIVPDPKLKTLANPYDMSERLANGVTYYNDYQYFNDSYHIYYGPAVVFTLYYPIYLLTGKIPAPSFGTALMAFFAVSAFFIMFRQLYALLRPRCSALLFFGGELSVIAASLIYYQAGGIRFYCLAIPCALAYTALMTACLCAAQLDIKPLYRRLLLTAAGVCLVMVVLSRPTTLFIALCLAGPLCWRYFFAGPEELPLLKRFKAKAPDILCLALPLTAGAIFAMLYNYERFGSVLDFGQQYSLSIEDSNYKTVELSLKTLSDVVYFNFLRPYELLKDFPFFTLTQGSFADSGGSRLYEQTLGVFALPFCLLTLALPALLCAKAGAAHGLKELKLQRQICILLLIVCPVTAYLEFSLAAASARYNAQQCFAFALMSFLIMTQLVRWGRSFAARLTYGLCVLLVVKTVIIGYFISYTISLDLSQDLNPDGFVELTKFFSPLAG